MTWTTEVEGCFLKGGNEVKKYFQKQTGQMEGLVQLVRQRLTKQQKTTICALIVIDVHAKDIVEKLVLENVKDVAAFELKDDLPLFENIIKYIFSGIQNQ